ncbi:putative LSM domain superfamily, FDF domain, lsm14-like, DFDF domain-containing protein [Helianthus annuus]|uniref:LSM domain superfamily, FDF domain, lsm14-like, DFDF domain-containing protein n=1 Tax=Helianthus annuus TaxID=4232 RepID=A0A251RQA9_HELAN|nr:protein decapping 5 [Helianthus annuus]KAF5755481.1 putative LSM domain superfamily, FDF domain, lsm14-like, DFDF domain-containing protein [Helianthus annuus]KAJ0429201.1 putative LSM domain superfamily, FDF domain, lsm14-like, DFDF domain-containing protein [Helianthus annuus]KAJ0433536.1 putative LSM domain superfamily, FDF domain, lsm14-like, DFDF domain-containing protein [Helianthus annuus]KAJ0447572.1 putative LSM domain superfamily, FDF domain, lsm14-like, DFDF domain-containing prot
MATEGSRSSNSSVDSYIGSLISLTSKSEIRYEGVLYNINTEESSIGLTNVRSFGTEGRKKDGPQVMPSDKVYEYILFRGSDIKDLQVKSSQPVQPTQPINSDPAIIQSHYPRPPPTSSSNLPPVVSDSLSTPSTYNPHLGQPGSTFQGGLPLYQPGSDIVGPWGPGPSPPPNANSNTSGLAMPMYWPGYYAPPPNTLQQSLPRPPQGLGMPPSLQQPMQQYPGTHTASSASLTSNSLLGPTLPSLPTAVTTTDVNAGIPPISSNVLSGARFPYTSQSISSVGGGGAPVVTTEPPTPSLVTPGQLLHSLPPGGVVSAQLLHSLPPGGDVDVVQVSPASSSPPSVPVPVATEAQPPILPLPPQAQIAQKPNGAAYQNRSNYNYRGRERGRGSGGSRPVMKFTEEFDFNAMNEKFNKDEVWGTLGKNNLKEKGENATDEDEYEEENVPNLPKVDVKPVYSKDDFFDTLSSNTSDRQSNYGRTRFSEQMKLDTETFGEFSRYRGGGRGGRGPYRGGRSRGGGYYGRGGGYGYVGRGRGGRNPNPNQNATNDY